jgi:hypothetical protein
MKAFKRVVIGLLVLSVLLIGWSILTAAQASRLEKRLQHVEASYQELLERHHAFVVTLSNAMLRADAPRDEIVRAKAAIMHESLGWGQQ